MKCSFCKDDSCDCMPKCTLCHKEQCYCYPDNEFFDGTDGAHPAWWRGDTHGAEAIIKIVKGWLDGNKLDGYYGSPELNKLKERVMKLIGDK